MGRESLTASLLQEMRRGNIVLCVLTKLTEPMYGYRLSALLHADGFEVDQNTLYPLLRRLSSQGLLHATWDTSETKPRKYYAITKKGITVRDRLAEEWDRMNTTIRSILKG